MKTIETLKNTVVSCRNGLAIAQGKLTRNTDPYQTARLEAHVERCQQWLAESNAALAAAS